MLRGVAGLPHGAAYGAREVTSLLTKVWVPTGRGKEGGRMVASGASYWAMMAVLERAQACERGYQSTGTAGG
jgi:hypothetical protein